MILDALRTLTTARSLPAKMAESTMAAIMEGQASPSQIAGLILGMRVRGETVDEVIGFARAMRTRGVRITASRKPVADTCGTGGGGPTTLNVSTAAALVAAGAGVTVAKHGNRAMTSRAGSADVFAALGVRIDAPAEVAERCLNEVGLAFCFAQVFHPAMKHAAVPRRELGVRTIFNLLGPLTNPAGAQVQLLGVASNDLLELEARALAGLGTGRALVVHSVDGLDELTTTGPTRAIEVRGHRITRRLTLTPGAFGFRRAKLSDLAGGSPEDNARAVDRLLDGAKGAFRDIAIYNAGFLCWLAGVAKTPREGITLAEQSIDSGSARVKLEQLRAVASA